MESIFCYCITIVDVLFSAEEFVEILTNSCKNRTCTFYPLVDALENRKKTKLNVKCLFIS